MNRPTASDPEFLSPARELADKLAFRYYNYTVSQKVDPRVFLITVSNVGRFSNSFTIGKWGTFRTSNMTLIQTHELFVKY